MKDFRIKRVHGITVCLILALVLGIFLLYYDHVTPAGQDPSQGGQNESASLDGLTVTAQKIVMEGRTQVSNTPVQVTFSGSYHHKPLAEKDRWFSGSIRIEGIPETEWEMRDVVFTTEESETLYGWMYYNDPKPSQWLDGVPKYQRVTVAMLHMTPDASQFIIWLAEDGRFSSHDATVILSPGMTLEYALEHDPYL